MAEAVQSIADEDAAPSFDSVQVSSKAGVPAPEVGFLLGAIARSDVGHTLQHSDHLYLEAATRRALDTAPSGFPVHWCNPDTGSYGTIVSYIAVAVPGAPGCRDLEQVVTAGGRTGRAYGTAGRQPDGSWKLVR